MSADARGGAVGRRLPLAASCGPGPGGTGTSSAICVAICAVMLSPIVMSVLASLKTTAEAAAIPPTYLPSELSLDSYQRLWDYQHGLPVYVGNSFVTAMLTIAITLGLTIPAGYALGRFAIPARRSCSSSCCWP